MGYNTSVIVLNDALSYIEKDENLGWKLADAVRLRMVSQEPVIDVAAGNHVNALGVIETHHADHCVPILFGRNTARPVLGVYMNWSDDTDAMLLRLLADKLGYKLVRKAKK